MVNGTNQIDNLIENYVIDASSHFSQKNVYKWLTSMWKMLVITNYPGNANETCSYVSPGCRDRVPIKANTKQPTNEQITKNKAKEKQTN